MSHDPRISFRIPFTSVWSQRSRSYLLVCPSLNLYSQCRVKEEAPRVMASAVGMFLRGCLELGSLEEVLDGVGFAKLAPHERIRPDQAFIEIGKGKEHETFEVSRALLFDAEQLTPA